MNYISFPGLGLEFNINPVAVNLFGISIYWYGIIIALGFFTAFNIVLKLCKSAHIKEDTILDMIILCTPMAIIGARLYYVLFNFSAYKNDWAEIFKIWHGGLAIYGAILATILTAYIYARVKHIDILPVADITAIGFVIAQSIGRWGNFVNAEAYGSPTNLPWRMSIYENGIFQNVHPTFLYESLWDLCLFIFLMIYYKRYRIRKGEVFLLYLTIYSAGRAFIEGLRADSLMLGDYRISQILAVLIASVGICSYFILRKGLFFKKKHS